MASNSLPAPVRPADPEERDPAASTTRRAILGAAILAPAIVACAANPAAFPARSPKWAGLVAAYRAAAAERDAADPKDWQDAQKEAKWEALVLSASKALQAVTEHPVDSFAQLAEKCQLVTREYPDAMCLDGDDCAYIIADVRRLAARGA